MANRPELLAAARRLSMPVEEIAAVEDSPAGTIITTVDGTRMIDVPDDTPDAEGKTGLMLLVKPDPKRLYAFPVYAAPADDDEAVELVEEAEDGRPEHEPGATEPAPGPQVPNDGDADGTVDDPEVPKTVKEMIAWVGDDRERAARAWVIEQQRPEGVRPTAAEALEPLIDTGEGG